MSLQPQATCALPSLWQPDAIQKPAHRAQYSRASEGKAGSPVASLVAWTGGSSLGDPGERLARDLEAPSLPVDILRRRSAGPSWVCREAGRLGRRRLQRAALSTEDAELTADLPGGSKTPGSLSTTEITSNAMTFDWSCKTDANFLIWIKLITQLNAFRGFPQTPHRRMSGIVLRNLSRLLPNPFTFLNERSAFILLDTESIIIDPETGNPVRCTVVFLSVSTKKNRMNIALNCLPHFFCSLSKSSSATVQ